MCDQKVSVSQEVEDFIKEIVQKHEIGSNFTITYDTGSDIGDGYLSRSFIVSIAREGKEDVSFFVKTALNITNAKSLLPFDVFYSNEIHFYDVIYPTFLKFLKENNVSNGFKNAPKCYGTTSKNIIALENLKLRGYALFDNKTFMNDDHMELAFKAIAKFHAISFAMKDQKKEEYDKLLDPVIDVSTYMSTEDFREGRKRMIDDFLGCLDPIKDKQILEKAGNLTNNLSDYLQNSMLIENESRILIQGDFWSNNVMFLYDNENQVPGDIMLIDWQMLRRSLPVYDLSFFFYNTASKAALDKLDSFLRIYHEELFKNIRALGSNPEFLFPYSALKAQWKKHGKYGFVMNFLNMILILKEKDENIFSFEEVDLEDLMSWISHMKIRKYDEYIKRMKILTEHMIVNDFL